MSIQYQKITNQSDVIKVLDDVVLPNSKYNFALFSLPAGFGKTWIIDSFFLKFKDKTIIACPTAISTSLLSIPCKTIHSLFKQRPQSNWQNLTTKLNYEIIIIDEFSMVCDTIFYSILEYCLKYSKKLIVVGDSHQLLPVKGHAFLKHGKLTKEIHSPNFCGLTCTWDNESKKLIRFKSNDIIELILSIRKMIDIYLEESGVYQLTFNKEIFDFFGNFLKKMKIIKEISNEYIVENHYRNGKVLIPIGYENKLSLELEKMMNVND